MDPLTNTQGYAGHRGFMRTFNAEVSERCRDGKPVHGWNLGPIFHSRLLDTPRTRIAAAAKATNGLSDTDLEKKRFRSCQIYFPGALESDPFSLNPHPLLPDQTV